MVAVRSKAKKKKGYHIQIGLRYALVLCVILLTFTAIGFGIRLGYQWLRSTPLLSVREILVECDDQGVRQRALELLKEYKGHNLLSIDPKALKEKLQTDPWIASARLSRNFPNGLHVAIEVRHAVAFLRYGGVLYLVDSQGRFFVPEGESKIADLVELKGIKPQGKTDLIGTFMKLVETRGKILCYKNIQAINIEDGSMIVITRGNKIPLRFSLAQPIKTQFMRAESILYNLYSSGKYRYVKSVDLWLGDDKAIVALKKKV